MPAFQIVATKTIYVTVVGDDRTDAVNWFHSAYPGHTIAQVDDQGIIGHCEVSGLPIFTNDEFESDSEGVMILKDYYTPGDFD